MNDTDAAAVQQRLHFQEVACSAVHAEFVRVLEGLTAATHETHVHRMIAEARVIEIEDELRRLVHQVERAIEALTKVEDQEQGVKTAVDALMTAMHIHIAIAIPMERPR